MRDWSWLHMAFVRSYAIRMVIDMTERALPVKIAAIHVLYQSRISDAILPLARPFMTPALRDSFVYYGDNLNGLHRAIPKSKLPKVIGGDQDLRRYSKDELNAMDNRLKQIWSVV